MYLSPEGTARAELKGGPIVFTFHFIVSREGCLTLSILPW